MKRAVITGLLIIGTACLIIGCGKKKEDVQEQEQPKTEVSEDKEEEEESKDEEEGEGSKDEDAKAEEAKADGADGADEEYQIIGTESEDAHKILLTNHTGDAITGFTVKASTDAEFPENMMDADMMIENDETVCLYYVSPETDAAESSSGKMLRTTYEFSISNENGREIRMPGLIFDDIEEAELCFEDEVGFIRYVSVDSGEEITTKEMALLLQAQ